MNSETAAIARRFGRNASYLRLEAGLSTEELAGALHISPPHLEEIEAGKECPPVELAFALAAALDVDVDALMAGVDWSEPPDTAFYVDGRRIPPDAEANGGPR